MAYNAEYHKKYKKQHADKINNYNKIWRKQNPEKAAEYARRYYLKNKDKILERCRIYREGFKKEYPQEYKELQAHYLRKHRAKMKAMK